MASVGGLFSVALSVGLPRLAVSQHPALRSPDFPLAPAEARTSDSPQIHTMSHSPSSGRGNIRTMPLEVK